MQVHKHTAKCIFDRNLQVDRKFKIPVAVLSGSTVIPVNRSVTGRPNYAILYLNIKCLRDLSPLLHRTNGWVFVNSKEFKHIVNILIGFEKINLSIKLGSFPLCLISTFC